MPRLYALACHRRRAVYLVYLACAVPIAAISAFAVYGLGMPVAYFVGLGRVLVARPAGLPSPQRRLKLPADADPAVPQYFYGPAAGRRRSRGPGRLRQLPGALAARRPAVLVVLQQRTRSCLTWPLGVGGAIGMAAGTVVGAAVTAGCALVHLLAVGVSAALGAGRRSGAARAPIRRVLRVKNIRMVCPDCYERVPYPGYECPGRLHAPSPRRPAGPVRHRAAPLPVRHADEHPAAVRLVADERLLPVLRPLAGAPAGPGAGDRAALLRRGRRGQDPPAVQHGHPAPVWNAGSGQLAAEFGDAATTRKLEHAELDPALRDGHRQDRRSASPRLRHPPDLGARNPDPAHVRRGGRAFYTPDGPRNWGT